MKKVNKFFIIGSGVFILVVLLILGENSLSKFKINQLQAENKKIVENIKSKNKNLEEKEKNQKIPDSNYIHSEFICQAPLETQENWKLHEESCEEAALLQTYLQETNQEIKKIKANQIILEMIDWQKQNFGGHYDIYADKIKKMAMGYYGLRHDQVIIIYDANIEDIKKVINSGHTLMVPVTAKFLNNPYYPHRGYHMLQVIGYDEEHIITNENGTRRGKDYVYDYEIFKQAMHDSGADIIYLDIN